MFQHYGTGYTALVYKFPQDNQKSFYSNQSRLPFQLCNFYFIYIFFFFIFFFKVLFKLDITFKYRAWKESLIPYLSWTRVQGHLFHSRFFTQHGFRNAVIHFFNKKSEVVKLWPLDFIHRKPSLPCAFNRKMWFYISVVLPSAGKMRIEGILQWFRAIVNLPKAVTKIGPMKMSNWMYLLSKMAAFKK